MAAYTTLTLDTTAPAGVTLAINGGASSTANTSVTADIATSDSPTTSYEMKLWGDVDGSDPNVQATEGASAWVPYATTQALTLSAGQAEKTIDLKVRDDVGNESSTAPDTIILSTGNSVRTLMWVGA